MTGLGSDSKVNRVIIAGGRDVKPAFYLDPVKTLLSKLEGPVELVTGTAMGADQIPYMLASEYGEPKEFPANWEKYGKSAGYIRNKEMADYATHLIAIWDGYSRGTGHMIDLAGKAGLKIKIISYKH